MTICAHTVDTVLGADDLLERMVGLSSDLHCLSERHSSGRQEHEFLKREFIAGMRAAVDHVECWAGEDVWRLDTSELSKVLV